MAYRKDGTRAAMALSVALLTLVPVALTLTPTAEAATPITTHIVLTTSDGTRLTTTFFTPAGAHTQNRVPYVLLAHDWAETRATTPTPRITALLDAGYGVVTWDSRGFGASSGDVQLNSPDHEVQDVRTIINNLQVRAPVILLGEGLVKTPVVGMAGRGYGGALQLLAAADDPRIRAIAPEDTWNNLQNVLVPGGVPKTQAIATLLGTGQIAACADGIIRPEKTLETGCLSNDISAWLTQILATNQVPPAAVTGFAARSPAAHNANVNAATLLIQSFADTLYPADEALATHATLQAQGTPTKLWLHEGTRTTPSTQTALTDAALIAWFDCYLRINADCTQIGPDIEYYGADNAWHTTNQWPPTQESRSTHFNGIPPTYRAPTPTSQSTWTFPLESANPYAISSTGSASITATVRTFGTEAYLFATLGSRDLSGNIQPINGQTQPLRIQTTITGSQRVTIDLVTTSALITPGRELVLTLTTGNPAYAQPRSAGNLNIVDIDITWASL